MSFGSFVMESSSLPLEEMGLTDLPSTLLQNQNAFLDGYQWRPLSGDLDLASIRKRLLRDVFSREAQQLGLVP